MIGIDLAHSDGRDESVYYVNPKKMAAIQKAVAFLQKLSADGHNNVCAEYLKFPECSCQCDKAEIDQILKELDA